MQLNPKNGKTSTNKNTTAIVQHKQKINFCLQQSTALNIQNKHLGQKQ